MGKYSHKIRKDLKKGKKYEDLFCELSGATKGTFSEDVNYHTDVWLDGRSVDVKGLKRSHKKGYILLEFINVAGDSGWCSPAGADKIAFLMPDGFYLLENKDLYEQFSMYCYHINEGKVLRQSRVMAEDALYMLVGRKGREDVFTYIRKEDIERMPHVFYGLES